MREETRDLSRIFGHRVENKSDCIFLSELISSMLELEPSKRPTLAQVMGHPWLAPYLYRLATTLGALPCTSKVILDRDGSGIYPKIK